MALLTVEELRERIDTPASNAALSALLEQIEAELVQRLGAAYTGAAITETHRGEGRSLFLKRRPSSITSIAEGTLGTDGFTDTTLTAGRDYLLWADEGRVERRQGGWGARVTVQYIPQDDKAAWKEAELDLARLALARSAVKAESVGGEYSFTAPENWEEEKARVIQRLSWLSL